MGNSDAPKSTPTNTSLREEIHLKMLAKSESAKDLGELTVVPLGFAVDLALSLLTAKTNTTDNINLIANAKLPGTWIDPITGNKLYNEAAVAAKTTVAQQQLLTELLEQASSTFIAPTQGVPVSVIETYRKKLT